MNKTIQVVAFDNPYPPDYGGAIDVFYKIQSLYGLGVKIHLHFFSYGNRKNIEPLTKICETVFQYDRNMGFLSLFSSKPFVVKSRDNEELLYNLSRNPAPILFEGLHCCSFLNHPRLKNHFKIVRTHNVEHDYYKGLYKNSSESIKKLYYIFESEKLKIFERIMENADVIFSLSIEDAKHFEQYQKTEFIPPFHKSYPDASEKDRFILFHGNLAVEENIQSVLLLTKNVFKKIKHEVIIAGKMPSPKILQAINTTKNIALLSNLPEEEMTDLICRAKCHVLYTNQNTGVKLKLVNAIQSSGHIILNDTMLFNQAYREEVEIANDWPTMIEAINKCMESKSVKPRPKLKALFNNSKNAQKIVGLLP